MPAVGFDFFEFEARLSVEHRADHLAEDFKEQRPDKGEARCDMQSLPVRLYTDSYRRFYQGYGFFTRDILDHLQINRSPQEDHPFGMYLFFLGKSPIFAAQLVAKGHCVIYQDIRLLLAELFFSSPRR